MTLYSKIIGTGSYLPQHRVTNEDLTAQLAAKDAVSLPTEEAKPNPDAKPQVDLETPGSSSMMGLFGYDRGEGSFPVMETMTGVAGVALIAGGISSDGDDDTTLTTAAEAGFSDGTASGSSGTGTGSGTAAGTGTGTSSGNTADGSTGEGTGSADSGGDSTADNPLDMLLAATPLGTVLAPITSAAGLEDLTSMLPL